MIVDADKPQAAEFVMIWPTPDQERTLAALIGTGEAPPKLHPVKGQLVKLSLLEIVWKTPSV